MGRLTTHILDTANGCPGATISISLYRVADKHELLTQVLSNSDGRCDKPLLQDEAFSVGKYELVFEIGDYYRKRGTQLTDPAFLDDVVIRFSVAQADQHYHIPLLVSPYSYSTYRGS